MAASRCGVVYGVKTGGGAAGLAQHPHFGSWMGVVGLVADGVQFVSGNGGSGSGGERSQRAAAPDAGRPSSYGSVSETAAVDAVKQLKPGEDAVLEEERAQRRHGRGQVVWVVLDRVREGVVDPVGESGRTSRGAEEEVGHLRVQV